VVCGHVQIIALVLNVIVLFIEDFLLIAIAIFVVAFER
jgi:hypothetical protein